MNWGMKFLKARKNFSLKVKSPELKNSMRRGMMNQFRAKIAQKFMYHHASKKGSISLSTLYYRQILSGGFLEYWYHKVQKYLVLYLDDFIKRPELHAITLNMSRGTIRIIMNPKNQPRIVKKYPKKGVRSLFA